MIWPLFRNHGKKFLGFLEDFKIPKGHFKIPWALSKTNFETTYHENEFFLVFKEKNVFFDNNKKKHLHRNFDSQTKSSLNRIGFNFARTRFFWHFFQIINQFRPMKIRMILDKSLNPLWSLFCSSSEACGLKQKNKHQFWYLVQIIQFIKSDILLLHYMIKYVMRNVGDLNKN